MTDGVARAQERATKIETQDVVTILYLHLPDLGSACPPYAAEKMGSCFFRVYQAKMANCVPASASVFAEAT